MSENPLVKALPPETDYLSYLTILEYNLSLEQLPTLHEILQDTTLTSNIGWDLVHLLLPLLPASKLCLQDVARLGNPREVVLKVTELLEELRVQDEQVQSEGVANGVIKTYGSGQVLDALGADVDPRNVQEEQQDDRRNEEGLHYPPSKALRFCVLLEMLAVLHPRIKTKYPSRFLSTSLQAILPAYAQLADSTDAFEAVVGLMKELSGSRRPRLPPRKASSHIPISEDGKPQSAPDPEAQSEAMTSEEIKLQLRLLQSFLTYVIEAYMSALSSNEDVVGMEWSSRLQEKLHPEKVVPGHAKLTERFANNEKLHALDTSLGQMLALAQDLQLTSSELLQTLTLSRSESEEEVADLPSTASDVPLSHPGCLYLLAADLASKLFFDSPKPFPSFTIYPQFSALMSHILGEDRSMNSIGTETSPLLDALLFLGLSITESPSSSLGTCSDTEFTETLQRLSLLSANTPIASLRYSAHVLCSRLLHAHPDPQSRLAFIKDTLEHCPYENLKGSAVGWLKEEILSAANTSTACQGSGGEISPFETPVCLLVLKSHLLAPAKTLSDEEFLMNEAFFLQVLNLWFLLFSARELGKKIDIEVFRAEIKTWIEDLESKCLKLREGNDGDGEMSDRLALLEGNMEIVKGSLRQF